MINEQDLLGMATTPEEEKAVEDWTGNKKDTGKPPIGLVPPEAIWALAKVTGFGAAKYAPRNWEAGMAHSRMFGAAQRHLWAYWGGEDIDPESGMPHLWHALTSVAFLSTYYDRGVGEDDRK